MAPIKKMSSLSDTTGGGAGAAATTNGFSDASTALLLVQGLGFG